MGRGKELAGVGAVLCSWLATSSFAGGGPDANAWRSIETPRYSVLSQLGERETRAWAAEFDVFIDSLSGVLGARQAELPPLTVVLFSPEDGAQTGCAVRRGIWGLTGILQQGAGDAVRRSMLREGVHWMTSTTPASRPAWLETGLAEMFSTFEVRGGHVRWGEPMPDHLALLRERGLIPVRDFLEGSGAAVARDGDARRFTAQAWALTHLLLVGGQTERRERFAAWLRHGGAGAGVAGFRAAFLDDVDQVQRDLQTYIDRPRLESGLTPRGMVERKYRVTAASRSDVEAALGQLEPQVAATSP